MRKFKELQIWKRSVDLASTIYSITQNFPPTERYGLISQMRRCSVSISSNIAEGAARTSKKEFKHYLDISYGSLYELHTQVIISSKLGFIDPEEQNKLETEIEEIQKMLYSYAQKLIN